MTEVPPLFFLFCSAMLLMVAWILAPMMKDNSTQAIMAFILSGPKSSVIRRNTRAVTVVTLLTIRILDAQTL